MSDLLVFSDDERKLLLIQYKQLSLSLSDSFNYTDRKNIRNLLESAYNKGVFVRDNKANPFNILLGTCLIMVNELSLKRRSTLSYLLFKLVLCNEVKIEEINQIFTTDISSMIRGLIKIHQLYEKKPVIQSENFSKLLLTFSEDLRVVLIILAEKLYNLRVVMRTCEDDDLKLKFTNEASYLYAPLSHRLGLYKVKSELEDLALKYSNRKVYSEIAKKLAETKKSRDAFIKSFISPIEERLNPLNIKFEIKGRTKSIHSIYNKLRKQQIEFEKIYDLFAIRIIVDVPYDQEKIVCWNIYSIITDMYQPNPKRLKDWISIPKSNGYESLHITVLGPQNKWVEVQIRSQRMDEIAESGLAAHWKYKGGKAEKGMDEWLKSMREILEDAESTSAGDIMQDLKPESVNNEIYVFTPKGDVYKLPIGSTVLDFAFEIHTNLGCKCVGAKIGSKIVNIRHKLTSGDQIEILSSPQQSPKQDWLKIVKTSRARIKIKQSFKEEENKLALFGKELFYRRMKNRKIDVEEAILMRLIKKEGFKMVNSFFAEIANEKLDVNLMIDHYLDVEKKEKDITSSDLKTADSYVPVSSFSSNESLNKDDEIIIDRDLTGIDYKLAKCCNPIYGDDVFGFLSINGGIKIHRIQCPNAHELFSRFGYRILKAKWMGKAGSTYPITLYVIGNDDIGIVTNITSIINKEKNISLRSISIDTHAGLFEGQMTVMVQDLSSLDHLIRKIESIKGVKSVSRTSTKFD